MSTNDGSVEHDIYRMLTKTFLLLDDCDRQFFAEYGLSTRQFWALQHVGNLNGCAMVDLSRLLLTDKSNITGIVDRLERLGLVTRTADTHDRRVILITLTPEGQQLRAKIDKQHNARISDLLHIEHAASLHSVLDYLQAISSNIEAYLEQAHDRQEA